MTDYAFGIDVSHHQDPASVDYKELRAHGTEFVYVRALYGILPDARAAGHLERARAEGMRVGLYAFFRPGIGWQDQLDAFVRAHSELGVGAGDLAPTVDVEDDRNRSGSVIAKIDKSWSAPVEHILEGLRLRYGAAILYGYESGLPLLGGLHLRWPLWVAHYRGEHQHRWPRASVLLNWAIHQYGVGPGLEPRGEQWSAAPGALDRNYAQLPLAEIQPLSLDPLAGLTLDAGDISGLAVLGNQKGLE